MQLVGQTNVRPPKISWPVRLWLYSSHTHIYHNFTNITYAISDIRMAGAPNHALKRISVTGLFLERYLVERGYTYIYV